MLPKEADNKPWDILYVDVIGQNYFALNGGEKKIQIRRRFCLLMIDPAIDGDRNLHSDFSLCRISTWPRWNKLTPYGLLAK